jgi:hypothetical protein
VSTVHGSYTCHVYCLFHRGLRLSVMVRVRTHFLPRTWSRSTRPSTPWQAARSDDAELQHAHRRLPQLLRRRPVVAAHVGRPE